MSLTRSDSKKGPKSDGNDSLANSQGIEEEKSTEESVESQVVVAPSTIENSGKPAQIAFIREYLDNCREMSGTLSGALKNQAQIFVKQGASLFSRFASGFIASTESNENKNESVFNNREAECQDFINRILAAEDKEDKIALILEAGKKARHYQSETSHNSKGCKAMHAVRTAMIKEFKSIYPGEIEKYCENKFQMLLNLEQEAYKNFNSLVSIEKIKRQSCEILVELCDLGHSQSLARAAFFNQLPSPYPHNAKVSVQGQRNNPNLPNVYEANYYITYLSVDLTCTPARGHKYTYYLVNPLRDDTTALPKSDLIDVEGRISVPAKDLKITSETPAYRPK